MREHPDVDGQNLLGFSGSLTAQTQFLYQRFLNRKLGTTSGQLMSVLERKRYVREWLQIIHECLYDGATTDEAALRAHPYLWSLLPLIKKSVMTINYNFDDTIERMLYAYNIQAGGDRIDKGFETVWEPSTQFRRANGVLYHPNGYLPLNRGEGGSEQIVFMEQEMADQLIDVGSGHYSCLLNHLSKYTLLFLGLSLNDATLKHCCECRAHESRSFSLSHTLVSIS